MPKNRHRKKLIDKIKKLKGKVNAKKEGGGTEGEQKKDTPKMEDIMKMMMTKSMMNGGGGGTHYIPGGSSSGHHDAGTNTAQIMAMKESSDRVKAMEELVKQMTTKQAQSFEAVSETANKSLAEVQALTKMTKDANEAKAAQMEAKRVKLELKADEKNRKKTAKQDQRTKELEDANTFLQQM
jgi:hypothetical protein